MNRRVLSWMGLLVSNTSVVGIAGPFSSKSAAATAVEASLGSAPATVTGGVFPVEFEQVARPQAAPTPVAPSAPAPSTAGAQTGAASAASASTPGEDGASEQESGASAGES